ncbi:hypothetical protein [Actinoplanes sp. NPDC051411]|uniref:hypothetical protein n=1 Tax=Actinoplanes sp. NPDC051411 TaxID=3155522 RepID=UPI00342DAC4A
MRKTHTAVLAAVVVLGAMSGCARPDAGTGPNASAGTPGASRPSAGDVLPLDFARTGGLAGLDAHLHITDDGQVTVTNDGVTGKPKVLDTGRLATLKRALTEAAPPKPGTVATAVRCADGFRYLIRTPSWSITADDCAAHTPAFDRAVALLLPLLQARASSP